MKQLFLWLFFSIGILALGNTACNPISTPATIAPVTIKSVEGSEYVHIILTEMAAKRLGIQDFEIKNEQGFGTVVPDAAIFYGLNGDTWVYVEVDPLAYVHYPVLVEYIKDNKAKLIEGPPSGSKVVITGGAQLLGIETGLSVE